MTNFQCFYCRSHNVTWENDFTFDDCGYDGEGLVQFYHCFDCGADIEYRIPEPTEPVADDEEDRSND